MIYCESCRTQSILRNPIASGGRMQPYKLDPTDRRILRELQQDGALRNDLLAQRIALTPAPTLRRVRALEEAGVISRYAALLDPERVGLSVRVKVDVRLATRSTPLPNRFRLCPKSWNA
jgi:Lrp/AsnC family transcriptional regulator, leucine-responsive regulatory protein